MSDDHDKEINAIADRIIKASTDIDMLAGELAEFASEEVGTAISKRGMLEAITDFIMRADAEGTSGAMIMAQDITSTALHIRHCGNCAHQKGDEMCADPGKPSDEGCKNWEPEPLKATVTFQYEEKQPEDKPSPFEIPKEAMEALQYSESDMQEMRGRTLEALDMMTDIALQQMPGSKKRWLSLRTACIHALRNHWKHHDEAIKPYREEAKSHE